MTTRATTRPWVRTVGLFGAVFLGYFAGAMLSLKAFGASELGPAFFPPAGITVAAMLMTRRGQWPVVVAAIVLGPHEAHVEPDAKRQHHHRDARTNHHHVHESSWGAAPMRQARYVARLLHHRHSVNTQVWAQRA